MKVSTRNVHAGLVTAFAAGPLNAEVGITLEGGATLVAVVTRDSTRELGLQVGARVSACVEPSAVVVVAALDGNARISARNRWRGVVGAVRAGPINADVSIVTPGGATLHAVITREAVAELGLAPGVPALAVFNASQVTLAL